MKGTKIILIGVLMIAISFAAIIFGGMFALNEEDSSVNYREIAQSEKTDVTCYMEIHELSDMIAQRRRYYTKGFYYANDGTNTYLVYLNTKDAEKYMNMDLKRNPVKVKGTTGKVTKLGKNALICDKETKNSLPDYYFNGTSRFGKKSSTCFATAAISFGIAVLFMFIGILGKLVKKA